MTTKDILAIHKANEVHNFLFESWETVFKIEMSTHANPELSKALADIRTAIDKAEEIVLSDARKIKIK